METTPYQQAFILYFGEMGSRWGINRTVSQVYALLYIIPKPLNAEQITDALGISRSNTSMAMKELQSWRLVRVQHVPDDRRDYFTTPAEGDAAHATTRFADMLELIELVTGWLDDVSDMDQRTATQLMRLGGSVPKLLAAGWRNKAAMAGNERA